MGGHAGDRRRDGCTAGTLRKGVEPICAPLPIAPSTYCELKARQVDTDRRPDRARQAGHRLIHRSDRGSQYLSVRYGERLAEVGIEAPIDNVGDPCDNALAETIIGPDKAEVTYPRGPWRTHDAVECATLERVDWFENRRLLESIGNVPPAGYEPEHRRPDEAQEMAA